MPKPSPKPRQEYDPNSENPPMAETDTTRPKPIGIPEDYPIPPGVPNYPSNYYPTASPDRPPKTRYMLGDEYLPATYSANRVFEIQQNLQKTGLLTSNFSLGVWDQATRNAYKELLGLANAQGQTAEASMSRLLATVEAGGGPVAGGGAPPLVISQTPPEELSRTFRKAVIDMTGRGWSQEQIDTAISTYQSIEAQRQSQAYSAQYGAGGTVESIPSPQSFIESQIQSQQPEAVESESALTFMNQIMDTMKGWS